MECLAIPLRDVIIGSTFIPSRAIDPRIRAIDLGVLGEEADRIIADTMADPGHPEIGKVAYATHDGKILIDKEQIVSYKFSIRAKVSILYDPWLHAGKRQKLRACATLLHSHRWLDLPPSGGDLGPLFLSSEEALAQTLAFVVTPAQKYLVFRGENSAFWDPRLIGEQIRIWDQYVHDTLERLQPTVRTQEEMDGLNGRVQFDQMRQICEDYDLRFFSCPTRNNIALRHTA